MRKRLGSGDAKVSKKPKHLYKFVPLNARAIDLLCRDDVVYSDPRSFNDPLDCNPIISGSMARNDAEAVLLALMKHCDLEKLAAASRALRIPRKWFDEHQDRIFSSQLRDLLANFEDWTNDPDCRDPDGQIDLWLDAEIRKRLIGALGTGVLSLSDKWNCPVMWAHYGDLHSGLCIGYETDDRDWPQILRAQYGASREIDIALVRTWLLDNCQNAKQQIKNAALLSKASRWRYESEWRIFGPLGEHASPLKMTSVTFGVRTSIGVQFAVMSALRHRSSPLRFWKVLDSPSQTSLKRTRVRPETLQQMAVRVSDTPDLMAHL